MIIRILTLDPFSARQKPDPQHPPQFSPQSFGAPHFLPSERVRRPDPAAEDEDVPQRVLPP